MQQGISEELAVLASEELFILFFEIVGILRIDKAKL